MELCLLWKILYQNIKLHHISMPKTYKKINSSNIATFYSEWVFNRKSFFLHKFSKGFYQLFHLYITVLYITILLHFYTNIKKYPKAVPTATSTRRMNYSYCIQPESNNKNFKFLKALEYVPPWKWLKLLLFRSISKNNKIVTFNLTLNYCKSHLLPNCSKYLSWSVINKSGRYF